MLQSFSGINFNLKLIFICWFLVLHIYHRFIKLIWFLETAPEEQPSPPVFVKELMASVALENSSHRLDCIVEGNPLPTVQWFKNDVNIDNSPDYVITYNNGEAVLKFEEVFLEDKATYTCKATNRLGQASTSAFLDVEREELYILLLNNNVNLKKKLYIQKQDLFYCFTYSCGIHFGETIFCHTSFECHGKSRSKGETRMRSKRESYARFNLVSRWKTCWRKYEFEGNVFILIIIIKIYIKFYIWFTCNKYL